MLFQFQKLFQIVAKGLKTFCHSKNLSLLILVLSCLVSANGGQAAEKAKAPYQRKDAGGLYNTAPQNTTAQSNQAQQQQEIFSNSAQQNNYPNAVLHDAVAEERKLHQTNETVGVYLRLKDNCEKFGQQIYGQLAPATLTLCSVFFILLLVWKVCIEGLMQKNMDIQGIGKSLISFCFVSALLSYPDLFKDYFYEPVRDITIDVASKASGTWSDEISKARDASGLLKQVDKLLSTVQRMVRTLEGADGSWFGKSFTTTFYAMIVYIVYFVLGWLFLFYFADMFFGLMVVTALAPLFIAGYLFRATRGYSESAIRLAVCSCLTVVLASLCVGLVFNSYVMEISQLAGSITAANAKIDSDTIRNVSFTLTSIGFLCLLFMRKSAHMASTLCGTSDSGASGLLIGAGMSAAYMAKNVATMGISKVAGAFSGAASAAGGDFKRVPMYTLDNGKNIYSDQDITGV